jgi:hypothetical protein
LFRPVLPPPVGPTGRKLHTHRRLGRATRPSLRIILECMVTIKSGNKRTRENENSLSPPQPASYVGALCTCKAHRMGCSQHGCNNTACVLGVG